MTKALCFLVAGACLLALCSGFMSVCGHVSRSVSARGGARSLYARKGKPNIPIEYRGQYMQQQRMQELMSSNMPDDGFPVFNLFVRSTRGAGLWFPFAALKGDGNAKTLVTAYMGPFLNDLYKNQLDKGVARSVFQSKAKLVESAIKACPQFKKSKPYLEFGYKIAYEGLEEKMGTQEITRLTEDMTKTIFDNLKDMFKF